MEGLGGGGISFIKRVSVKGFLFLPSPPTHPPAPAPPSVQRLLAPGSCPWGPGHGTPLLPRRLLPALPTSASGRGALWVKGAASCWGARQAWLLGTLLAAL